MKKTKIDWCDSTWNPVTGCLHGCEYCYARRIAERFKGGGYGTQRGMFITKYKDDAFRPPYELDQEQIAETKNGWYRTAHYPFGFEPTLHRYRMNEPVYWKKPSTVFVCSMADLFGRWVPNGWIQEVFSACKKAPQHRYLFLTKNPSAYLELALEEALPTGDGFWYGSTVTSPDDGYFHAAKRHNIRTFLSIEPLLKPFRKYQLREETMTDWVIIGAETGNRKGKVVPEKKWVERIVEACRDAEVPVFMKESLRELMGEDFVQEFPWEEGVRK